MRRLNIFFIFLSGFCLLLNAKPVGLGNIGNSCFCNALTQNLVNLEPCTKLLFRYYEVWCCVPVVKDYLSLLRALTGMREKGTESFSGSELTMWYNTVQRQLFQTTNYNQQDASELWNKFWSRLDIVSFCQKFLVQKRSGIDAFLKTSYFADFSKKFAETFCTKVDRGSLGKEFMDLLYIWLQTQVSVQNEEFSYKSKTDEFCSSISVPVVGNTLESCLGEFFAVENVERILHSGTKVEGKDGISVELTSQFRTNNAKKQFFLTNSGDCLIIHLKRFTWDLKKIGTPVSIPISLDMTPYFLTKTKSDDYYRYHLIGVVAHSGTLNYGHYWAYINDLYADQDAWYRCDDSSVRTMDKSGVSDNAYMVFYLRESKVKEIRSTQGRDSLKKAKKTMEHIINEEERKRREAEERRLEEERTRLLIQKLAASLAEIAAS